ncbi:LOW QUALITY PROTEIN: A-kinase anchor protein 7-like [Alosa alosa]|uniref:LOW QUALITY PROTEIN: A-kinase anchor protein 7-like n=1 Tax=Alosa alosa TaxID=278164 RepID=UPI0020153886|nr:LOW QUALITY PROTEIN: A-kinase anchor protein 7-like [Alosa alosa]
MFGRHVFETLTKLITLRGVHFPASANVRLLVCSNEKLFQLTRASSCNILPSKLNYMDMQPPGGLEVASLLEVDIPMEHDSHELSSATVASFDTVPAEKASSSVKGDVSPEKAKRVKKKAKKPHGRKKQTKISECTDDLMAELPFAGTKVWKDLEFTSSERLKKKRKIGESGESEEDGDGKKKKKKKESHRPNYFVSIPITNPQIKAEVEAVQAEVIRRDPRLSRALIPTGSLHITLLVTHLGSQEQVDSAACALDHSRQSVLELLEGRELVLPFSGVTSFKNEVVFVQLTEGEHVDKLTEIAEAVRRTFVERGIAVTDDKAFKPHLTFMKLSRAPRLRSQGIKKLDPELYTEFSQQRFGDETLSRLDLCSMLKKKSPDGYFHREKSVSFDLTQRAHRASRTSGKKHPEPDDEELVSLSKRLVDDAVLRAVQQYMEETQQSNGAAQTKGEGPTPRPSPTATQLPANTLNSNASK